MDWQFKVGLGLTIVFGLLAFAVKDIPHWLTWPIIGIGLTFAIWGIPPIHDRVPSGPGLLFIAGVGIVVASVAWFLDIGTHRDRAFELSFQKYALYWVNIDKDVYQLGTIAKFANLGDKSYLIDRISFNSLDWSLYPRGSYHLQQLLATECKVDLVGGNYIRANSEAYLKTLLPIKFFMTVDGGQSPELIIRGNWNLAIGKDVAEKLPSSYSVFPQFLSPADWDALRDGQLDDLHFKPIPPRLTNSDSPLVNYLVYNSDRTATIDNVYFTQTPVIKGQAGVMLFIRGKGPPPLGIGWAVLGNTYGEVWSDPKKLALYNSLFPPGADGLPKPFGYFSGSQGEMAGAVGRDLPDAPTTTGTDILEIVQPCDQQG